jgi:hypothetical protein
MGACEALVTGEATLSPPRFPCISWWWSQILKAARRSACHMKRCRWRDVFFKKKGGKEMHRRREEEMRGLNSTQRQCNQQQAPSPKQRRDAEQPCGRKDRPTHSTGWLARCLSEVVSSTPAALTTALRFALWRRGENSLAYLIWIWSAIAHHGYLDHRQAGRQAMVEGVR